MKNKNTKNKRKWDIMFIVAIALIILVNVGLWRYITINKPPEVKISIAEFGGRVFDQGEIRPGTFTIEQPFNEAIKWGEDAIMHVDQNAIEIWKPDKTTEGVFLYSKQTDFFTDLYQVGSIKKEGEILTISPTIQQWLPVAIIALNVILIITCSAIYDKGAKN